MSKCIVIFLLLFIEFANAFDPTVVVQGAQLAASVSGYGAAFNAGASLLGGSGGGGILGGGSRGGFDEMVDVGFALSDLFTEVGIETETDEQIESLVRDIDQKRDQLRSFTWATDDLKRSLGSDLNSAKSLSQKLKAAKSAVEASKRLAVIMGFRPKSAERASHLQQIRLNHLMLEELQGIRKTQLLSYLEDQKQKADREMLLNEMLVEEQRSTQKMRRGKL